MATDGGAGRPRPRRSPLCDREPSSTDLECRDEDVSLRRNRSVLAANLCGRRPVWLRRDHATVRLGEEADGEDRLPEESCASMVGPSEAVPNDDEIAHDLWCCFEDSSRACRVCYPLAHHAPRGVERAPVPGPALEAPVVRGGIERLLSLRAQREEHRHQGVLRR